MFYGIGMARFLSNLLKINAVYQSGGAFI